MMEYRKFNDYTDSDGAPFEFNVPYEVERWGTDKMNIERCADGHFSLLVGNQDIDLTDDLVKELHQLCAFYLEHTGQLSEPPAPATPRSRGAAWVELDELWHRMEDWTVNGGKPDVMSALLDYEAWRVEMDAGRGCLVCADGTRRNIDGLFAPRIAKRRQKVRNAGKGRGRKRKAA